ncbi:MAG: alpha-hydroxy-acid oxidizing protein [Acidobacteria bacterium]|nr:alpha-hydroxy-acid oxidizing protein [Acidobacteriota bacterium]
MSKFTRRRHALRQFAGFLAASPLWPQALTPQQMDDDVNGPINVHEFEEVARRKLNRLAYDFIAGGVEDELALRANREAFSRHFIVPRFMRDVSEVSTGVELLGMKLATPLIIAPTGGKNLVLPRADEVVAAAALKTNTLICTPTGTQKILEDGHPLMWWTNNVGAPDKASAITGARRVADQGCKGIVVTVDNAYQSNRDRNNRNRFDYGYMQTGVPKPGDPPRPPRNPARPAMWQPHVPSLNWSYIEWVKGAVNLPIILKGILHPEDAALAVKYGADAISVSNHGGRQMDGVIAPLDALPDAVEATGGRIPVLMDGGIRRGSDVIKALALGAKAVLLGRAPLWGLGAYGQPGVERVLTMLSDEVKLGLALSGARTPADLKPGMIRRRPLV